MSYLTVDELHIPRTLGITVPSTILSTSLVAIILGHSTIRIHSAKVQGAVQTTRKLRYIHIKSELGVGQVEHLVRAVILHQIQTRSDIGVLDEGQCQSASIGGDTVGAFVICTIDSTVLSAGFVIGAEIFVPLDGNFCQSGFALYTLQAII